MLPYRTNQRPVSRRSFLGSAAAGAAATLAAPAIHAADKASTRVVVGSGEHQYEVHHDWVQLPGDFTWQTTHNVAVDRDGMLYVIHEGKRDQPDHPSIFVFDRDGKFVRAFGNQFQGGGHGLEVRDEGGQQFLYVTGYQHLKNFAKLDLKGEVVWEKRAPMKSELYADGEDTRPQKVWGRNRFMPTNFAFLDDGGFFLADGYGAYSIHRYDKDANWMASFGGAGKADGKFNLPHGLWWDNRPGRTPSLVVADRVNARLQWFSLEGQHQKTLGGFILPANIDVHDEIMLVPDLSARITLLDGNDEVIVQLGEDPAWRKEVLKNRMALRRNPPGWRAGRFLHPHDACFDADGNIIVAEWVATGRITKLRRLG